MGTCPASKRQLNDNNNKAEKKGTDFKLLDLNLI